MVGGLAYVWPRKHLFSQRTRWWNFLKVGWVLLYQYCLSVPCTLVFIFFILIDVPRKRNEPLPNLKSAIRLVRLILVAGLGAPEFQRQVVTPNVPKFTTAIIGLAEKYHDEELKVMMTSVIGQSFF